MDRRGRIAGVLIAAAASASAAVNAPLLDARWVAPGGELAALTERPPECFAEPDNPAVAQSAAIGRAAFRAPLLLGGQAARAGLSCEGCHRNGRGNPHFLFPGLSGEPGTADVTTALFSRVREDGVFNPRPIPDLAADAPRVSRHPESQALEAFIRDVIVEEFDGAEPPPRVLRGLVDYVRALSSDCPSAPQAVTLAFHLRQADEAVAAAQAAWRAGDAPTTRLMLASARSTLGLIDERFAGRAEVRAAGLELAAIQAAVERGAPDVIQRLALWKASARGWSAGLERGENDSLYMPELLARRLGLRAAAVEGGASVN